MNALDPSAFDLLTFDCYGTLIDWETGLLAALRPICERHGVEADDDALLVAFANVEHVVEQEAFRTYRKVLEEALGRMGRGLGFEPTPDERASFADSVGDWPPFPDSPGALARLAGRYRLGIVSNVDDDLFARSERLLGADFDWVVTAQQVASYKPAAAHFEEMARRSRIPVERTLHVAQSLFHDIGPARSFGYNTVWVNRRAGKPGEGASPASDARPNVEVPDMEGVANLLVGS